MSGVISVTFTLNTAGGCLDQYFSYFLSLRQTMGYFLSISQSLEFLRHSLPISQPINNCWSLLYFCLVQRNK